MIGMSGCPKFSRRTDPLPELVLIYLEQSVLSGEYFTISISQILSVTFAKSNQDSGLILNRMPDLVGNFALNNVITLSLGKIHWFLTSLFGKMANSSIMACLKVHK